MIAKQWKHPAELDEIGLKKSRRIFMGDLLQALLVYDDSADEGEHDVDDFREVASIRRYCGSAAAMGLAAAQTANLPESHS